MSLQTTISNSFCCVVFVCIELIKRACGFVRHCVRKIIGYNSFIFLLYNNFFRWGYDNGLVLEPMSQTDSSFTFLLDNGNCQSCDPDSENYNYEDCYWQYNEGQSGRDVRGSCYDGQLFIGHGEGRKARNNAFQQCMSSYAPYVARFDCSGGMVAENYWETVTPSPPSNATTAATVP